MDGIDIAATLATVVLGGGGGAAGAVLVLKNSMGWHKEKLDRHSEALARAFTKMEELTRELHNLRVEMYRERPR